MRTERITRTLVLMLTLAVLCGCSIGRTICDFALKPEKHGQNLAKTRKMVEGRYPGINAWYDSLRTAGVFRDTVITNDNGLKLHAVYAGKAGSAEGTALLIHGYSVNHIAMLHLARMYRDEFGFNVLLPDLRHHGLSEGGAVTMGWLDRLDALRWVGVADDLWKNDFLLVHGVSMGAATTMMLSGEPDLPSCVKCFIEDCGYSSVWDQFNFLRMDRTRIGEKPLLKASECCERLYGWDFRQASSLDQLAKCDRPMLFIHGDGDDFVPTEFVHKCYEAKTKGYKELWIVENTPRHALSYHDHPQEYTAHVSAFIARVKQGKL